MNYKLKKYEWVIYFLMIFLTLAMIVSPIALWLDGIFTVTAQNMDSGDILQNSNIIIMAKIIFIILWVFTWGLIEFILMHLLSLIKSMREKGTFIEKNKQSAKNMRKYLILFGIISVLFGQLSSSGAVLQSVYKIEEISSGVGVFTFLSTGGIQITLGTVILIIIYVLINVVRLVFKEGLDIKEINDEIV